MSRQSTAEGAAPAPVLRSKRGAFFVGTAVALYVFGRMVVELLGVNSLYVVLAAVLFDQMLSGEKAADRLITLVAALLGILPVLGWLHGADVLAPIELTVAIWFTAGISQQTFLKIERTSFSLIPAVFGSALTFMWWRPISRGTPASVLARILPQWDNSAHFLFFLNNLINRKYLPMVSSSTGLLRLEGREYPTGIHYVWSLFVSQHRNSFVQRPSQSIPTYALCVAVTLAVAVGVATISTSRLTRNHRDSISVSFVACGLSLGLICVGPLSQAISAGFANMPAVVIGVLLVITVGIRPIKSDISHWIVLLGGSFCILYNWYPLILLVLPILISQWVSILRRKGWLSALSVLIVGIAGGLPPIVQTLSLGLGHLAIPGGITPFPKQLGVSIALSALGIGVLLVGVKGSRDLGVTLLMPSAILVALGTYLRMSTGDYPYYFQKTFLLVSVTTGVVIFMTVVHLWGPKSGNTKTLSETSRTIVFTVIVGLALANVTGYVGPDRQKFAPESTASGLTSRNDILHSNWEYAPTMQILINSAEDVMGQTLAQRSCNTLFIPNRIGASGEAGSLGWKDLLVNVWFHVLSSSYTRQAQMNSYATPAVSESLKDEGGMAAAIAASFGPDEVCPMSTSHVNQDLRQNNPAWRTVDIRSN